MNKENFRIVTAPRFGKKCFIIERRKSVLGFRYWDEIGQFDIYNLSGFFTKEQHAELEIGKYLESQKEKKQNKIFAKNFKSKVIKII